jgi:eukaryotic-like serine/threonine-protein kinase
VRLTPGSRVGPYEVVSLLGAGGMAEVYRAKDTRLGRDVAIKVVSEALGGDAAFLERFDREAKLAASLAHPNVVALFDVGLQDGKPYFVTELLQGESLRERLAKGPIPLGKALEWAAQMAQGLAAAHERGIVHRDLKPENVFITRDGHVKLLDFGIAKLIETAQAATPHGLMDETVSPSGGHTRTGVVVGTPGYMSPEQVRGDPVDSRTDFFSLGAVLYEMLSGGRAFPAGPVVESGFAILHNEPELLSSAVPPLVAQVVHRCLEKDAGRRFQSARDLAFNLEILRTPTGSTASRATAAGVPASTSRRRRWLWPLAGGLAVLGIAGATYFVGRNTRLPTPSVEQITFGLGRVSGARFNPEGRVVFSAAWNGEPLELFARASGSPDAQSLGLTNAHLFGVSTTGELAVSLNPFWNFGEERGTLALLPGAGGAAKELAENIVDADWSPTGELAAVRVVGGNRQLEYPLGMPLFETAGFITSTRVSPHGDAVAFIHSPRVGPGEELMVVDRRGRARTLFAFSTTEYAGGLAWLPDGEEVWFSTHHTIWASPLSGGRRLVYQGVSSLRLEDISPRREVLVTSQDWRWELAVLQVEPQRARGLSWLVWTELSGLSDDGRQVLFTSSSGTGFFSYIRRADGAPPVKIGPGRALALSPDEKWVLTIPDDYQGSLVLLPVGPGVPRTVSVPGLTVSSARWLQGGTYIALIGRATAERQSQLYLVSPEGGVPTLISSAAVSPALFEVSRDNRLVAAHAADDTLTLYPLDGGPPVPLPELGKNVVPVGWTADGQLWLRALRGVSSRMLRYDIRSRRTVEERTISPSDVTGFTDIGRVCITPDGRTVAFNYVKDLNNLYLLNGLARGVP